MLILLVIQLTFQCRLNVIAKAMKLCSKPLAQTLFYFVHLDFANRLFLRSPISLCRYKSYFWRGVKHKSIV